MPHLHFTITSVKHCWECHDARAFDSYLSEVLLRVSRRTCIWLLPEWSIVESVMTHVHLTVTWMKYCWESHDARAFDCYLSEVLLRVSRRTCIWRLPEWGTEEGGQKESRHAGQRLEDVHDGEWNDLFGTTTENISQTREGGLHDLLKMCHDGSSSTGHKPCNNHIAL